MHDWKLSPLPTIMLGGWAYHESQHRREVPEARRPWRSLARRGVATIRRLLATGGRPTSGAEHHPEPAVREDRVWLGH